MEDKRSWIERAATNGLPNPADYPLGSAQSRAAARSMCEALARVSTAEAGAGQRHLVVLSAAGSSWPNEDGCLEAIHQEAKSTFEMVVFGLIPEFVSAQTEKLLLQNGWHKHRDADSNLFNLLPVPPKIQTGSRLPSPAVEAKESPDCDLFKRMDKDELDEYAKTGVLPSWYGAEFAAQPVKVILDRS